ncbi:MAG: DUF4265 domain-containing protein [Deinococcales bacterium]|nr:DUF4265 domain-containing protein [Chitinophagaceae bacterium]
MSSLKDTHIKFLYRFYSDTLEQDTVETMWAIKVDVDKGLYKLDSIPFYAKSLAVGDIIEVEYDDDEQALVLVDIIEFSGHSTIQVVILHTSINTDRIREIFRDLGCSTEKQMERYFAIDVPINIDYSTIKQKLTELEVNGAISFAEACLSEQHSI